MTTNADSLKPDALLRFAIGLDGTIVGLSGVLLVLTVGAVSRITGLPTEGMHAAGLLSIAYGPIAFALASVKQVRPGAIVVIASNLGSTVAVGVTVIRGAAPMTTTGVVLALAVGVYTAAIGALQYVGFRRMGPWHRRPAFGRG
jgi:hypothetical protein